MKSMSYDYVVNQYIPIVESINGQSGAVNITGSDSMIVKKESDGSLKLEVHPSFGGGGGGGSDSDLEGRVTDLEDKTQKIHYAEQETNEAGNVISPEKVTIDSNLRVSRELSADTLAVGRVDYLDEVLYVSGATTLAGGLKFNTDNYLINCTVETPQSYASHSRGIQIMTGRGLDHSEGAGSGEISLITGDGDNTGNINLYIPSGSVSTGKIRLQGDSEVGSSDSSKNLTVSGDIITKNIKTEDKSGGTSEGLTLKTGSGTYSGSIVLEVGNAVSNKGGIYLKGSTSVNSLDGTETNPNSIEFRVGNTWTKGYILLFPGNGSNAAIMSISENGIQFTTNGKSTTTIPWGFTG
jgi:hypothetical protein